MIILALDPSGSYEEGKGTTGVAIFNDKKLMHVEQIRAEEYDNKLQYWKDHLHLINDWEPDIIVVEDYLLYADKAKSQIHSRMETPKLLGIIEYHCLNREHKIVFQRAVDVKRRWKDEILEHKGFISKSGSTTYALGVAISKHIKDAIRHGAHYTTLKLKEDTND